MFSDSVRKTIKSKKKLVDFLKELKDELENIGTPKISKKGVINVSCDRMNNFASKVLIDGRVKKKDGKYRVELDFEIKPEIITWIIAICCFPIGLLIFVLPYNLKSDVLRKIENVMNNLGD